MIYKKMKKSLLISCLVLCLCSGCTYNNQDTSRSQYIVANINGSTIINSNNAENDYFFRDAGTIYQYSVSEQKIINTIRFDNGPIDLFAADDEYIFYMTDIAKPREHGKIWRYNRESGMCELYLELDYYSDIKRMTVYDGYLLYGHDDIYVCPVDGEPGEDCVSLLGEFPDTDSIVKSQEISYQNWRVWRVYLKRKQYHIAQIVDEANGEVILSNGTYGMNDSDGVDLWMDGEWIYFTKDTDASNFYYQQGYEADRQKIDCLDDRQYCYSFISSHCLTVEGQKVIGILSVSKDPHGYSSYQRDIKEDVLFEIDLENDSSQILYSTKNNKTRIIGYQEGKIYLWQDDVIYEEDIEGKTRKELLDLREEDFYGIFSGPRKFYFCWYGNNLIICNILDGEVKIKSISISDQEL